MTKNLQREIDTGVRRVLASLGIRVPAGEPSDPTEDVNYIGHGTPEHARFIGLITVDENDDPTGFITYVSQGVTYRLEDEMTVLSHYPNADPEKAALMVLRQKVNEFEAGEPEAPDNAPNLWQPVDKFTVLVGGGR
jgi:hypothetical protein